jgi:hypothetical protein
MLEAPGLGSAEQSSTCFIFIFWCVQLRGLSGEGRATYEIDSRRSNEQFVRRCIASGLFESVRHFDVFVSSR